MAARLPSSFKGGPELRARLKAIKTVWKPIARKWGRADVMEMRRRVPNRTGRLRRSFRVTSVTGKRVRVGGHFTAYFIDAGPKPHTITAKGNGDMIFRVKNKTIFTRKVHHRGYAARPFRQKAAVEAMRQTPQAAEVIKLWNDAA
jgi:hypothetical protein